MFLPKKLIAVFIIVICISAFAVGQKLKNQQSLIELLTLRNSYPYVATQPAAKVNIHYKKGGVTKNFNVYDNLIDLQNPVLTKRVAEAIYNGRERLLICPDTIINVDITEESHVAKVRIHWSETVEMFDVTL